MSLFEIVAVLLTLAALFAWLTATFTRLPHNVGLLVMALAASLVLVGLQLLNPDSEILIDLSREIAEIDFSETLLHGMLGFLLFAGALQVDLGLLRDRAWSVGLMATLGVLISTVVIAAGFWGAGQIFGYPLSFAWCLVFGALISPTDPIAVLAILKTAGVPRTLEMDMAGESLFNDGVGVVLFTILLSAAITGGENGIDFIEIGRLFFAEALGGVALGLFTGLIAYLAMRRVDDYPIEVLISLALVTATYALAIHLHISGPIAVVVAGVFIGNRGAARAMSETTREHLFDFWNLIDEILNSVLFLLIGLEVLVLQFDMAFAPLAAAALPVVLFGRFSAVALSVLVLSRWTSFTRGTVPILTWGGVRGGISVALALSIPNVTEKPAILAATYLVALFTIVVQGLTLSRVIHWMDIERAPMRKTKSGAS
ncbi:sodium:proton antiporter [Methyloligella sp. 2.7D]|uniref:cation:proton antiporter n=1 Tax=unclassified Methyloligella TaxID=2625955 RepID=UPI00157C6F9E|nr:sodium:proton antiporter [Methyloligella sp. GL2]QKP76973.1 sodium:proton antiporter [Methyloligella sp. GL2]